MRYHVYSESNCGDVVGGIHYPMHKNMFTVEFINIKVFRIYYIFQQNEILVYVGHF